MGQIPVRQTRRRTEQHSEKGAITSAVFRIIVGVLMYENKFY